MLRVLELPPNKSFLYCIATLPASIRSIFIMSWNVLSIGFSVFFLFLFLVSAFFFGVH